MKTNSLVYIFTVAALILMPGLIGAQSFNADKNTMSNYIVRMYKSAPFDGVRLIDDYEKKYLISVIALSKSKFPDQSVMNRVASTKAMSQAARFFNAPRITSELIIRTTEKTDGTSDTELLETITEDSTGYVKALELLTNFPDGEQVVYVYCTELDQKRKKHKK